VDVDAADGCKLLDYFVHIMTTTLHASSWLYESRAVQANLCPAYVCVARFISGTETVTENLCFDSFLSASVMCCLWTRRKSPLRFLAAYRKKQQRFENFCV